MWGWSLKRQFTIFSRSQSLAHILIRTHEFNRASTKRQYNLLAIFQYLFNFNELFEKRLCQCTYGFSFKLQGKCNILLVLLQRAASTNLAYETKIVDSRGTKELLLDSLPTSPPGRSGGEAGRAPPPVPPPSRTGGLARRLPFTRRKHITGRLIFDWRNVNTMTV